MPDYELPPARPLAGDLEDRIDAEIRGGLQCEQDRLAESFRVLDYYNLDGHHHLPLCDADDHECHRKSHPLTRRVIEILTSKSYSHPPTRTVHDDDRSQEFLSGVYGQVGVDELFQAADELSTLLGVSAVYVAPTGDSLRPLKLYVYDYSQFVLYPDPDDCTRIAGVVLIERWDERTRYTWWTSDFKRVYETKQANIGRSTSGGRVAAYREDLSHANVFGRLPFGFFHYKRPTSSLTGPGLGPWLAAYNSSIDATMLDQALAIRHFYLPRAWVSAAPADWQPTSTRNGEFMRLPGTPTSMTDSKIAQIGYLQAALDIEQGVLNVQHLIDTALAGIGCPRSLYAVDQTQFPSGDAIEAEQQPLVDYTRRRQGLLTAAECDVAAAVLAVGGGWYGDESLRQAGLGGVDLSVRWPVDLVETGGVEQARQDQLAMEQGVESLVSITQRRYRFASEAEALEHLVRVHEDNIKLTQLGILPGPQVVGAITEASI